LRNLKIAILSYRSAQFGGGQGVYVKDISYALSLMGHNVDVISGPPYPNLHHGINLIRLPGLDLFETFDFKDRLKRKIKADTIIMNSYQYYLEVFRSLKLSALELINF
jgi:hypothetical protein